jgi:hypothetical protein
MVDMGTPDTSDIDLNPANFRCRADLVYCLEQLHTKIGGPSYRDLQKTGQSRGIELSTTVIGGLIGKNSKTNPSKLTWKTVELFVLACGVPKTELDGWRKAWQAAVAPERPAWQEERQYLHATIDQLTADLTTVKTQVDQLTADLGAAEARNNQLTADLGAAEARTSQLTIDIAAAEARVDQLTAAVETAEARAVDAEQALIAYHQSQSSVLVLPEPLEQLRIKADTYYDARDYTGAVDLYRQIATQVQHEHGPDDPRTLQAQRRHLEVETKAFQHSCLNILFILLFRASGRHKLNVRWRQLICAHQRWLPEGSRATLELRLDYMYWVSRVLNRPCRHYHKGLSPARKLLISLHADCKTLLPSGDPFTEEVAEYMHTEEWKFSPPDPRRWSLDPRLRQQERQYDFSRKCEDLLSRLRQY